MTFNRILFLVSCAFILVTACHKDKEEVNPGKSSAVFNPTLIYGTVKDKDSITYKTIKIGSQTWMAENLRTTRYNDGSMITDVTDNSLWKNTNAGAYCTYNNTKNSDSIATFGRLYNWYAVNTGKLAPKGWHVPTSTDWIMLIDYLGDDAAANKLFETGVTHWAGPNSGATNESGFTILPGGYRDQSGSFLNLNDGANFWTSTAVDSNNPVRMYFLKNDPKSYGYFGVKNFGFSIRCVKD
ncbi:MAG TPA: fibrobacter succinogenes major paralogous domain-containing protein [Bacteroidales bacterium]|nr:fibrobacter succinogenes major paralogous domain-containing protein [Bacteroidales bacterium]